MFPAVHSRHAPQVFAEADDGKGMCHVAHRLVGSATAAGAAALAWQAARFRSRPSAAGIYTLTETLEATRGCLQGKGLLPSSPPEGAAGPSSLPPPSPRASTNQLCAGWERAPTGGKRRPLRCVGVDADWCCRVTLSLVFEQCLGARHAHVLASADGVVDRCLGCTGSGPGSVGGVALHADVVVLSERIAPGVRGSDLAMTLHSRGFCGVVCVLTALDARELDEVCRHIILHAYPPPAHRHPMQVRERARYGVDLALPKGTARSRVSNHTTPFARASIAHRSHVWLQAFGDVAAELLQALAAKRRQMRERFHQFLRYSTNMWLDARRRCCNRAAGSTSPVC